jgi:hypothetical protein
MVVRSLTWALAVGLLPCAAPLWAAEPTDPKSITHLITRLQSSRFADREEAAEALEALGAPALTALEGAIRSSDPELQRRAEQLHRTITWRVESGRLMAGKQIRLTTTQARPEEVFADLSKQTGWRFQPPGEKLSRVSLDTGKVSFWEAFDRLCASCNLVEVEETADVGDAKTAPAVNEPTFHLVQGKRPSLPTCYSGAVRVRALDTRAPGWGQAPGVTEVDCVLEVSVEPGLQLRGPLEARITRAVDDGDRELNQFFPDAGTVEPSAQDYEVNKIKAMIALQQIELERGIAPAPAAPRQLIEVRLKVGDQPSKSLKELHGTLNGRVTSMPEVILESRDVTKVTGETIPGKDGVSLRVQKIARNDGQIAVEVDLDTPPSSDAPVQLFVGNGRRRVVNRLLLNRIRLNDDQPSVQLLQLEDATGNAATLVGVECSIVANASTITQHGRLTFELPEKETGPYHFVLRARRTLAVEVPFTLRQVPLP